MAHKAHSTSNGLMYWPAFIILTDCFFPADSLHLGVRPAQEQRCLSETKGLN